VSFNDVNMRREIIETLGLAVGAGEISEQIQDELEQHKVMLKDSRKRIQFLEKENSRLERLLNRNGP